MFGALFQIFYNNKKSSSTNFISSSMINPFTSNQETQFLFRKNYQAFHKTNQTSASPQHSNNSHIQSLQRRNPFTSHSPIISVKTNNFSSPERALSVSKNFQNSSHSRYLPGRGGLLQEVDGWRKELQKKQREKMQIYGAEGLRYNAYLASPTQRKENSDYFHFQAKKQDIKSPKSPILKSSFQSNFTSNYYFSPTEKFSAQKQKQKQKKEHFQDEIFEESPNFNLVDPRKQQRQPQADQSKHSKVKDMFESQFQDRFKQSNNYGSYFGMIHRDTDKKNRNSYNSSRFAESKNFHVSAQSQVQRLELITPDSIKVGGRIYYKIQL